MRKRSALPVYDGCTYTTKVRKKSKKGLLKVLICFTVIAVTAYCIVKINKNKDSSTIADYSRTQLKAMTTAVINQALLDCVTSSLDYGELVSIHKDTNGKITLIESNWTYLNLIARETSATIETELNQAADKGIRIPLGNLTGWPLLTGIGPDIEITVSPQESVECSFRSEFTSAGINQTLHKIYLEIVTSIDLVMPTYETTIVNVSQVLIAEGIIVGEVPEIYLNNSV